MMDFFCYVILLPLECLSLIFDDADNHLLVILMATWIVRFDGRLMEVCNILLNNN